MVPRSGTALRRQLTGRGFAADSDIHADDTWIQ